MLGIALAIISAIFMAAMQIFLKKSYKELNPSVAYLFDMLFGVIIWIPIGFLFGATLEEVWKCLPYAIISAIFFRSISFLCFIKGKFKCSKCINSNISNIYINFFSIIK